MFTGLVEEKGTIRSRGGGAEGARIAVRCALGKAEPLVLGESISVSGCCLSVVAMDAGGFEVDASAETLAKEQTREKSEARGDDAFKNCTAEVERRDYDCAMRAATPDSLEKCLE